MVESSAARMCSRHWCGSTAPECLTIGFHKACTCNRGQVFGFTIVSLYVVKKPSFCMRGCTQYQAKSPLHPRTISVSDPCAGHWSNSCRHRSCCTLWYGGLRSGRRREDAGNSAGRALHHDADVWSCEFTGDRSRDGAGHRPSGPVDLAHYP